MATACPTLLERLAEGVLVLVILSVTVATWLPALIGADPDPSAPVARERAAVQRREQDLQGAKGASAAPIVPAPAVPAPSPPELTAPPSPAPVAPADRSGP